MSKIKCEKNCCEHNYECHCTRDGIYVSDVGNCTNYEKGECACTESQKEHLHEEYGKENDVSLLDEHLVECDSLDCVNNFSNNCSLGKIKVASKGECAQCASFHHR